MAKILLISYRFFPDIGGIESISEMIASVLSKKGYSVKVITTSKITQSNCFPYKVIRDPNLIQLLKAHFWADVVLENNPSLRLSWPNLFFFRPLIVGIQTWLAQPNGSRTWKDGLKKIWLKRANKVVACSKAIQKECFKNAKVIQNPYDDDVFKIRADVVKKSNFIFVGRLVADKGVTIAIKAFNQLLIDGVVDPKTIFTIVGAGPELNRLSELTKVLGLNDNIIFTGVLKGEKLAMCLNEHSYMIVPSIWEEPFGIVTLEGMACGCLPFVSNCGGLPEAVDSAGITFEKGNIESLIHKIAHTLSNETKEKKLREAAENHLKKHSKQEIANAYLAEINNILN